MAVHSFKHGAKLDSISEGNKIPLMRAMDLAKSSAKSSIVNVLLRSFEFRGRQHCTCLLCW